MGSIKRGMAKKGVSSVELAALIEELQSLVRGKVSQIYHQEKKELLLQMHAPGEGKKLLKVVPGKFLCLTTDKKAPLRPTGFCMQLRKYLGNAFVKKIEQKGSERIVVFELERKGTFFLIVELFSKGNIVLTDSAMEIIAVLQWQKWKDRVVKPKEKYVFPAEGFNWKKVTLSGLKKILAASEKKNLATSLATEVGLGGLYAEEVCLRAGVDKNVLPGDTKDVAALVKAIKGLLDFDGKGYVYENEITPSKLEGQKIMKTFGSYNAAINTLNPFLRVSPYEKKIAALKKMIAAQEDALVSLEEKISLNSSKGEKVYEEYAALQKLLDAVASMRKSKDWVEIGKELKSLKKIKSVNLKDRKVVLEL